MTLFRNSGSFQTLIVLGVVALFAFGCTTLDRQREGSPFFPVSDNYYENREELGKLRAELNAKIGKWTLAEAEKYVMSYGKNFRIEKGYPDPLPQQQVRVNVQGESETLTWKYGESDSNATSVPTTSWRSGNKVAFAVVLHGVNGVLTDIWTSLDPLPSWGKTFSTRDIVAGAGAAAAIYLLTPAAP